MRGVVCCHAVGGFTSSIRKSGTGSDGIASSNTAPNTPCARTAFLPAVLGHHLASPSSHSLSSRASTAGRVADLFSPLRYTFDELAVS